jgi:hypothetical protein
MNLTPEQFEKIALFMGWEKVHVFWRDKDHQTKGIIGEKLSFTDAEAVELLNALVEKERRPNLWWDWQDNCWYCDADLAFGEFVGKATISEAVTAATLALNEREEQ